MNATDPRSLRDIVAAGDNPLDHEEIDHLIDDLRRAVRMPVSGREQEAANMRATFEQFERDRSTGVRWVDGRTFNEDDDPARFAMVLQHFLWAAELYEDPTLADRVIELLPPAERLAVGVSVDQARSPHPLGVESLERWGSCDGCGADIEPGKPVLCVGSQPDYSEDEDIEALVWCAACLRAAAAQVDRD